MATSVDARPDRTTSHHATRIAHAALMVGGVAWIVFAIVVLVLRYAVLPHVGDFRDELQKKASRAFGETVTIGSLTASWQGLRPSLALHDVEVVDATGRTTLRLPSVAATLAWRSLAVFQLRLASLTIDGAAITVERDRDGQLSVAGHRLQPKATPNNRAAAWLLAQDRIDIRRATIVWRDAMVAEGAVQTPPDFVLTDVAFALHRSGWRHRAALRASPPAAVAAPLDVRAVIDHPLTGGDDAEPALWSGEVYADVASGDVAAWRAWLPLPPTLETGQGRMRTWLRFTRADQPAGVFAQRLAERIHRVLPPALDRIADVTTDLALNDIAVRWGTLDRAALASIDGRVVASQTSTGQRLAGTHVALQPHGPRKVAPTDFDVRRTIGAQPDDESGKATLGAIDIGVSLGLVPAPLLPPAIAARLAALAPRGALERVAVTWAGPLATPRSFEADVRFAQLGVTAQAPTAEAIAKSQQTFVEPNGLIRKSHPPFGQPGFDHLSGTLHATRKTLDDAASTTDVSLDLDSHDVVVTAPGLFDDPTLRFTRVAARVGLHARGEDIAVEIDHAAFDNPDLAGTVELLFRRGPNVASGYLDLDARLSRGDVGRVRLYLPNLIGPKARLYLAKALVAGRIGEATLRLRGTPEQLDLRRQADALARPYAVPIHEVLAAELGGRRSPIASSPAAIPAATPATGAVGSADPTAAPIFHARIKVHDATFLYGPARDPDTAPATTPAVPSIPWPAFRNMDADVVIDHARMTIDARTARYGGFVLQDVHADLPALADPAHVLRVSGKGAGPLQDLVRFVNEGPMQRWVRHFTDNAEATGNATLALAFDLPLTHPRDAQVAGRIGLDDDQLTLNTIAPPVRRIDGRIDFTDRSLQVEGLTAETLGGPLRLDARTSDDGFIELRAAGVVDIATLRAEATRDGVSAPVATGVERAARVLSGGTTYRGTWRIRNARMAALADDQPAASAGPASGSDLVVESDLAGLGIDLPAPLAKPADARWPLRIELSRTGSASATPATDAEDIRIALADRIDVAISRRRDPRGVMAVKHAGYRVGVQDAAATNPAEGPTEVRIALPALDVDAWRDAIRRIDAGRPATTTAPNAAVDELLPARASLKTTTLHAFGRDFTDVDVRAERLPTGWQADVATDQVAGRLSYTDVAGRTDARNGVAKVSNGLVVARLSRLSIPQAETTQAHVDGALDASRQQDFPAIDLVAERFELRGRLLGRLEVTAENDVAASGRTWKLDRLNLLTPEARFSANGTWGHGGGDGENTRLDFDLQASDLGALMDRFGLTRTIKDGSGRLSGNAMWNGGPTTIDFATLGGTLKLAADRGEFLKADPGVAKLLNILSLQGLARRIRLDFSDVFGPGFAFDTVRADATVERGIATTDDFVMRGGLADVEMKGSADLQRETADLHVLVLPQINAGAASLGVAVANPAIGLGTFVAQYLFKDRISQALSFEYNVSGPWKTPEVLKIDHNGKVTPVRPKTPAPSPPPLSSSSVP